MKFRTKLIIYYILLFMIPICLVSYIYYRTSSNIILKNASSSMLEVVKKNIQFTDLVMAETEQRSLSLLADKHFFHLFDREQTDDPLALMKMDREASEILNSYFGSDSYVDSAQLATSYYSFGGNAFVTTKPTLVSPVNLEASELYKRTIEANGKVVWIPTYDISKQYHQSELADMDPRFRYVFSASRVMKASIIEEGVVKHWKEGTEAPVLILTFNGDLFWNTKSITSIDGSYLYVLSKQGEVIAHPDTSQLTKIDSPDWLKNAILTKSGTVITVVNGKKMLVCYDTSEVTGWITVLAVPYKELVENLDFFNTYILYIAICLIALSVITAFVLTGWLTKPIKKLLVGIQLIGNGNFTAKIPEHNDYEFGIVINRFNLMTEKIRDLINENYKVKLREKEAELMALNLQVNPHFLYNTLNIINWMALDKGEKDISKMIVSLSTMLQYAVKNKEELVPLRDDLTWLKSYLHIMENRYQGAFETVYSLDDIPLQCRVPKMFLQPIVENAIIHGFASRSHGGVLKISGEASDGKLIFTVVDNGKGMDEETMAAILDQQAPGVGIMNVQNRIKLLFGEDYGISFQSDANRGTQVTISLPLN